MIIILTNDSVCGYEQLDTVMPMWRVCLFVASWRHALGSEWPSSSSSSSSSSSMPMWGVSGMWPGSQEFKSRDPG